MARVTESFRRYFLRGLVLFLPIVATIWILDLVIRFVEQGVRILPPQVRPDLQIPYYFPGLGAIFTVGLIWLIGVIATHLVSAKLEGLWNDTLARIPVVRGIYGSVRQLVQAIFGEDRNNRFRDVVLIEYPRRGIWSLALVTGPTRGEIAERLDQPTLNVFIPTTPNPTSGWYIIVPQDEAIQLDMTVEEAFKVIISAGIVMDPNRRVANGNRLVEPPA